MQQVARLAVAQLFPPRGRHHHQRRQLSVPNAPNVTGVLHQPLPAHVHEFLAHYSPGTFYDKAIQEFGARVGLDASDLALRQFLIRLRNAKRQPALHHHPSAESAGA